MRKKLVGLSMIRNESDVLETFIRHNLTLLDELHIIDHGSSDGSREILNHLKEEGLAIHIYYYNALEYKQALILNNIMQLMLENDASIDYIFPLDADEFIYCPSRERLEIFLSVIPEGRVGMYTWRGYLPNSTDYQPHFLSSYTDQREENILTPKVIIPRMVALQSKLTIGSHFMVDKLGKEVKSLVFRSSAHRNFYAWFVEKFDSSFVETEELWLGHYPIRSTNQQIKKVLEKSITMAMKSEGAGDVAWENQLQNLLDKIWIFL